MKDDIAPAKLRIGNQYILFDSQLMASPPIELFCKQSLLHAGKIAGIATGRGETYYINWGEEEWVLRHYRRGGMIAKFFSDQYVGFSVEGCRSWREWNLLFLLYMNGMPVPRPVAASVKRDFGIYRADLITQRIPKAVTLAEILNKRILPPEVWTSIGRCLKRFHEKGVFHADLNARNILVNDILEVFLIDFDQSRFRKRGHWEQWNLNRLQRSLKKLKRQFPEFNFCQTDWLFLLQGYSDIEGN